MKKVSLILFLLGIIPTVSGQILDWEKQLYGSGNVFSRSLAFDKAGNIFTVGSFSDSLFVYTDTGYHSIPAQGSEDIYLMKLSPSGTLLWIHSFGAHETDEGFSIAVDAQGNVYINGHFSDTVDFDPSIGVTNLISNHWKSDIFICKYDPSGNLVWANQIGDGNVYIVTSISASHNGNIYLFGTFFDTVDFDPGPAVTQLYSSLRDNFFVAKYNTTGDLIWAQNIESAGAGDAWNVYVDKSENVYLVGSFNDTTDFDPGPAEYKLTSKNGSDDTFLEKLDSSGNFQWVSQFSGPDHVHGRDVTVDNNGNVCITGSFAGKVDFDPGPDSLFLSTDSTRNTDAFVSKLDSSGQLTWARKIGSFPYLEVGYSLVTDDNGNIYTTGYFSGTSKLHPGSDSEYVSIGVLSWEDIYLNKIDLNGNFQWTIQIGGDGKDYASDIKIDTNNNLYLSGHFQGDLIFDLVNNSNGLMSMAVWDGFVAKLNASSIGISETRKMVQALSYPNPFETSFTIDLGNKHEIVKVNITDACGRVVLKEKYFSVNHIDIHLNATPGIYYVSVFTNSNSTYVFKVIKK